MINLNEVYCFNDYQGNHENVVREMSVKEILEYYYAHWRGRVKSVYLSNDENENKALCLNNWVASHWAWKKE